jgi:VIT1/CCC1 family predicted Fe2+/Mn2+ transporter
VSEATRKTRASVLDPDERLAEILFGLIMVVTFTGTISAATAGREEVRTVLIEAFGCNTAWGIVDGVMYLMALLAERGRGLSLARAVRAAKDPERGRQLIADSFPGRMGEFFDSAAVEAARQKLLALPTLPKYPHLHPRDFLGALSVGVIVFLSTCPVVIPFLLFEPLQRAMRISNLVAIVMLYAIGHAHGKTTGFGPVRVGLAMVGVGLALILLTIALGG